MVALQHTRLIIATTSAPDNENINALVNNARRGDSETTANVLNFCTYRNMNKIPNVPDSEGLISVNRYRSKATRKMNMMMRMKSSVGVKMSPISYISF